MTRRLQTLVARGVAGLFLVVAAAFGLGATPAFAADSVTSYTVEGSIAADGMLDLKATLELEGTPAQVQQRFATTLNSGRDGQYRFTVSDVTASVAGQAVSPTVAADGDYQVVTVPTGGKGGTVEIAYKVRGAALDVGHDTTEVNWRVLQGLNLPVKTFDATLTAPGG